MFDDIFLALQNRNDLHAWSLQHISTRGAQIYVVPQGVESVRSVNEERYTVKVLCCTNDEEGRPACGEGEITLLPGDDIGQALSLAALIAGKVHNPPYSFPSPGEVPDVPLVDDRLRSSPVTVLEEVLNQIREGVAVHPSVHLTAAEGFTKEETVHFRNSLGIDCAQTSTQIDIEFVLYSRNEDRETESFVELQRRRMIDLDLEKIIEHSAQQVIDLFDAVPPDDYTGPVILRDETLAAFLNANVLKFLSSGQAKFGKITPWEIGKSIFRSEVKGDPLTVWANRQMSFGVHANRFDQEGIPAQRLRLIEDGHLVNFWAGKRYADYLSLPPTGDFGNIELPAGRVPARDLLAGTHTEIAQFSWFNPDPITGDFACEIRSGYLMKGGRRHPIKGGMLVGNVLDALANTRWSAETGFYGSYQGPTTARFEELRITAG